MQSAVQWAPMPAVSPAAVPRGKAVCGAADPGTLGEDGWLDGLKAEEGVAVRS